MTSTYHEPLPSVPLKRLPKTKKEMPNGGRLFIIVKLSTIYDMSCFLLFITYISLGCFAPDLLIICCASFSAPFGGRILGFPSNSSPWTLPKWASRNTSTPGFVWSFVHTIITHHPWMRSSIPCFVQFLMHRLEKRGEEMMPVLNICGH